MQKFEPPGVGFYSKQDFRNMLLLHTVGCARNHSAVAGPIGVMGWRAGRVVEALISVGAEVIALGLEQIGGQAFAAVGVVKGQGGAEGWDRNALLCGSGHHAAP